MADKTITALTATTSAATADEIPIWVAGSAVMRKVTKANFLQGAFTGGGTVATGGFTLTVPATGTAALLGTAQTFSAAQTFSNVLTAPGIKPASDSTTALQLQNAAGTAILTVDTTSKLFNLKTFQLTVAQDNAEKSTGVTLDATGGYLMFIYDSNSGNPLGALIAMYRTAPVIIHQGTLAALAVTSSPTTSQVGVYLNGSNVLCFKNNYTGLGTCVFRGFILRIGT